MRPPVAITGLGVVSPLGLDASSTWKSLRSGKVASSPVTRFSTVGLRCHHAAQVELPGPPSTERRLSRASRLAITAAREAVAQAGLALGATVPFVLSTTGGAMEFGEEFLRALLEKKRPRLSLAARYQPQQQAMDLQQALGIDGEIIILGNACASGANAIGHAADMLRAGQADVVIAGGFEALTDLIYAGFDCLQLLSPGLCRPFDRGRDGLLMGEGAAFLVLETVDHARARGASVLGHLIGYGHTSDIHRLTQPEPSGRALIAAMRMAGDDAGLAPSDIAYVNAHGTGTAVNDEAEAAALVTFFGEGIPGFALSSSKAALGHALGAAGCIEAAMSLFAARDAFAPPQLHLQDPMADVAAALGRSDRAILPGAPVMSVNLGFGGSNAALIFNR